MALSKRQIESEICMVKDALSGRGYYNIKSLESIRVEREVAKQMLKENTRSVIGGVIRFFQIKDIGLGICEIQLQRPENKTTQLVKKFS